MISFFYESETPFIVESHCLRLRMACAAMCSLFSCLLKPRRGSQSRILASMCVLGELPLLGDMVWWEVLRE